MADVIDPDLILLIPAWGSGIDMLRNWALPSLMQPDNLPSLLSQGVKLHLQAFTMPGEEDNLAHALSDVPFDSFSIKVGENPELLMCHEGPKAAFEQCRKLLLCPADQIWSNGSIANMWNYAYGKPVVVAVPHLRVVHKRWGFYWDEAKTAFPVSSKELVRLALHPDCLHASQNCWSGQEASATYNSGVSLTWLSEKMMSLIHWLPTPWLSWFTARDVKFFTSVTRPVFWDREWPSIVFAEDRLRVIGSSEMAFGVELSEEESTTKTEPGRKYFEGYFEQRIHHATCGAFVCSLEL